MTKTASISMEVDSGIKERAMAVLEARGVAVAAHIGQIGGGW